MPEPTQPNPAVLVADDDDNLRASVRTALEREGFGVREARDGIEAREALAPPDASGPRPSLVILDISMPRLNGLDLLRELRSGGDRIPVIFLTSRDEELDRVLGLELGADDYLPKPFSLRELAARIRAVLRRADSRAADPPSRDAGLPAGPERAPGAEACGGSASGSLAAPGSLVLDRDGFRAYWAGAELDLTVTEFRILDCLAERPGAARTRDIIVARAWPGGVYLSDRAVDCHVKRLRRKLREAGAGEDAIETVYGLGYRLRP